MFCGGLNSDDNLGGGDYLGNLSALAIVANATDGAGLEMVGSVYVFDIHRREDGAYNHSTFRHKIFPYGEQMKAGESLFGAVTHPNCLAGSHE